MSDNGDTEALFDGEAVVPAYGDGSFDRIPGTVAETLGVPFDRSLPLEAVGGPHPDVECVVLLVVDGFGLDCWQRDKDDHAFLSRLDDAGVTTTLTSTFPSETAATITSVHTGTPPSEHGVLGWSQYLPSKDAIVEPLPYRHRDGEPGDAVETVAPEELVRAEPIYPTLRDEGVECHALQRDFTIDSPYARRTLAGARSHPFGSIDEMASVLGETVEQTARPSYVYVHVPDIDTVSHEHGTDSSEYRSTLATLSSALERELVEERELDRTLLLLTADHGHVDTDPATNLDLLADDFVRDRLATREDGTAIRPVGGPRNVHLHLEDGTREAVRSHLTSEYGLETLTGEAALSAGLFGSTVSPATRRRCGDLLAAHPDRSVWYDDGVELDRIGQHGWVAEREMRVPLVTARLSAL